ncbi:MAG: dihydroorotate dehydrogenase [Armatimonadota bacterium]|nr:dihydroorotate dehydrogenase [Armatimonadota bacterium]MDW8156048.1 dihydroorotate dehydrogenase [Armatimonadota bacterium]
MDRRAAAELSVGRSGPEPGSVEPDLSVEIAGLRLQNPVVCASGPLGHGREVAQVYDLRAFGAFVTKSITLEPREGNPPPQVVEVDGGWLNSIGLRNPGLAAFLSKDLPFLRTLGIPVVASVAGHSVEEFCTVVRWLDEAEGVAAVELNVSCPNVADGLLFGQDPARTYSLVSAARRVTRLPLLVKLAPNLLDPVSCARAAVEAGADALTVTNTLPAMAVDVHTRRPKLGGITGGLSGPAIRPVAVRLVWEICRAVPVPVVGVGGVATWEHAVEFLLVGARAVGIGSALLNDPQAHVKVTEGLRAYLRDHGLASVASLVGALRLTSSEPARG